MPHDDEHSTPIPTLGCRKRWQRIVESVLVLTCTIGGGFGLGVFVGVRTAEQHQTELRMDHIAEIERLQRAHEVSLLALTQLTKKTAEDVESRK